MKSLGKHRVVIKSVHGDLLVFSTEIIREVFVGEVGWHYIRLPGEADRYLLVDKHVQHWKGQTKFWYEIDVDIRNVSTRITGG